MKKKAFEKIDRHRLEIIEMGRSVKSEPEQGYKEYKTAEKIKKIFTSLGLAPQSGLALTGVRADISGNRPGPAIAVLGELDALPKESSIDKEDHENCESIHACGHFQQLAHLAGVGFGIKPIMDELPGRVTLFAVPAEEYIDLEYRQQLKEQGLIKYYGGKQELIRGGAFDDIDIVWL